MRLTPDATPILEVGDLTEHITIFGATGCGKTGMTVTVIEEALLAGVPVLAIDTKGDLTNLALVFDGFDADDFAPWTDRVSEDSAAALAQAWKSAIDAEGGLDSHAALAQIPRTIYTPGSSAGIPLNTLASLTAPSSDNLALEVDCTLNALFELIDEPSDIASPGYVVCSNILEHYWSDHRPVDLEGLIVNLVDPPFTKVGVVRVDEFMDSAARRRLAGKLSLLTASPAFQALAAGRGFEPSDFFDTTNGPTCSIVSVGHLSDDQRQFVVSRLLAEVSTWMHAVGGNNDLRLLVVLDEAADYCPASRKPPAKDEVLELLNKGRGFGVGMLVTAHNPYDVDHRVMANASTWITGRLQQDQDLDRFVEAGIANRNEVREAVAGLDRRHFVVTRAAQRELTTIECRHTLSFLAGPLARPQIRELTERIEQEAIADLIDASARPYLGAPDDQVIATSDALSDLPQRWAVGEWTSEYGGLAASSSYAPALVVTADLRWDRDVIDLDLVEERHEINFPIGSDRWWSERTLGGLLVVAPQGSSADVEVDEKAIVGQISRAEQRYAAVRTRELAYAPGMRLWARPGETVASFRNRCRSEAIKAARAEILELDNHLDRQTTSALDRLAELSRADSNDVDLDELKLHMSGVVADLRIAKDEANELADEIEADWLSISSEVTMETLTIDPDADLEIIPWILWIPA